MPTQDPPERSSLARITTLIEAWQATKGNVAFVLGAAERDAAWLERLNATAARLHELAAQDAEVALYVMLQTAVNEVEHYSAHHAMFCAVVAGQCAGWARWSDAEAHALFRAALTMNVAMTLQQDEMARQIGEPTAAQRELIRDHAALGADQLAAAGVADALWLETVRRHHRPLAPGEANDPSSPAQRLARLLQRIDVFTAKLSRRRNREGVSPTTAARDACLDESGLPDSVGSMLLKVLGLYPPGSYVRLANHEYAVVIRRGAKAHAPVVACVRRADGTVHLQPLLRDTSDPKFAVQAGMQTSDLNIALNHERVLRAM
jgi:HD-GYP domain-containing protein (c-di-GMP phosphodiesterase class II)